MNELKQAEKNYKELSNQIQEVSEDIGDIQRLIDYHFANTDVGDWDDTQEEDE